MAQTTVTRFYNTRKRLKDDVKELNKFEKTQISLEDEQNSRKTLLDAQINKAADYQKDSGNVGLVQSSETVVESKQKSTSKKTSARGKVAKAKTTKTTKKGKTNQTTVTKFYQSVNSSSINENELGNSKDQNLFKDVQKEKCSSLPEEFIKDHNKVQQERRELSVNSNQVSEVSSNISIKTTGLDSSVEVNVTSNAEVFKSNITHSPKRTLPIPVELTPSKKKPHMCTDGAATSQVTPCKTKNVHAFRKLDMNFPSSPSKTSCSLHSPVKSQVPDGAATSQVMPCKTKDVHDFPKLDATFPSSPSKTSSSLHSPVKSQVPSPRKILSPKEKLNAIIDQSRSKLFLNPNLDGLRKSLESFSKKTSIIKDLHSNPYRITSVISPSESKNNSQVLPSTPAHEKYSHLAVADTSTLTLPFKFRLLADMFRSMDTVISILHNRKEKITFDKVQDGVRKMIKRNFSKIHVGQIAAVLPSAYSFAIEKCSFMNKKTDSKDYQLVITPVLTAKDKKSKKSKSVAFEPMHPQCLIDRRGDFSEALLKITKKHHQDFLNKLKFVLVPEDRLKRWHPKFPVDSVPDILPAQLPEPPEAKIYTAKDVLNKVKGTFRNKVEKALQSVADESKKDVTLEFKDISNPKPETSKAALKGICTDLLEKIRARESAKLLETMTRTPDETKRLAMLERLPKIIHILWHYFIAERKAVVPIDVAVEKIIHSFNSLTTVDDVKDHLKLITETFPGWLSFIEITKGVYIQIDKKRNINEMLDKFKH